MKCPKCQKDIVDGSIICEYCGCDIKGYSILEGNGTQQRRNAIESGQENHKSNTPIYYAGVPTAIVWSIVIWVVLILLSVWIWSTGSDIIEMMSEDIMFASSVIILLIYSIFLFYQGYTELRVEKELLTKYHNYTDEDGNDISKEKEPEIIIKETTVPDVSKESIHSSSTRKTSSLTIECPYCHKKIPHIAGTKTLCPFCNKLVELPKEEQESRIHKIKTYLRRDKYIYLSAVLSLLCIILLIVAVEYNQKYSTLKEEYSSLQDSYEDLQDDYSDLIQTNSTLQLEYEDLQAELENYKDQQATINDQNKKLEELQSQYNTLKQERDSLQAQVDAKKAEQERIAEEQAQQALQQNYGATVYWVSGGEVYHSTPNCSTLRRSSNIQSGTIAQSGKSRACKVCN